MSDDNVNETYLPVPACAEADRRGTQTGQIPDALWEQIEPLLPPELPKPRGGRPRMDNRKAMEAIFYSIAH